MKNILFTFLFTISLISFGQTWQYSEGGNAFDGKYKTSIVTGVGSTFPYEKPSLVVNKFEGESINFYITDAGYFQENTGVSVLWVFDNEPEKVYSTYNFSISNDGKILFFLEFNNPDGSGKLKPVDIIEKLTIGNEVTLRVSDDYGSNDIIFSLRGSSKAINFVIPKEERQIMLDEGLTERKALAEVEAKNQLILDGLMKKATEEKISSTSLSSLKSQFEKDLGLSYYSGMQTGKKYKSILVDAGLDDSMFTSYGYVDIFYILDDGSKDKILGTWTVEMDAPIFSRLKDEYEADNSHLENILSKYERVEIIDYLKREVSKLSKKYSKEFDVLDVESVKITLSDYRFKKFWNCKVEIILNDGTERVIDNARVYDLEISKKELKSLGGQMGVAF